MKEKLLSLFDKLMLRRRAVIESVFDQLKSTSNIKHSRHRSISNFLVIYLYFQREEPVLEYSNQRISPSLVVKYLEIMKHGQTVSEITNGILKGVIPQNL